MSNIFDLAEAGTRAKSGKRKVIVTCAITGSAHTGRGTEQARAIALHGGNGRRDSLVIRYVGELGAIEIRNLERSTVGLSIAKLWHEPRA